MNGYVIDLKEFIKGTVSSNPYASYGVIYFSVKLEEKIEGLSEEIAVVGRSWTNFSNSTPCIRKNDKVTIFGDNSKGT